MPFHKLFLMQGIAVAIVADIVLYWQMNSILFWHTRALERLLDLADVAWQPGRSIAVFTILSLFQIDKNRPPRHASGLACVPDPAAPFKEDGCGRFGGAIGGFISQI